jgi:hypothetical protein
VCWGFQSLASPSYGYTLNRPPPPTVTGAPLSSFGRPFFLRPIGNSLSASHIVRKLIGVCACSHYVWCLPPAILTHDRWQRFRDLDQTGEGGVSREARRSGEPRAASHTAHSLGVRVEPLFQTPPTSSSHVVQRVPQVCRTEPLGACRWWLRRGPGHPLHLVAVPLLLLRVSCRRTHPPAPIRPLL